MGDKTVKILHTGDLHLDSPLTKADKFPITRQDLRDVFYNIVELAKARNVDIVLISGDLFDNEAVSVSTREIIINTLSKADKIRFFIISGNHDYYKIGSVYENALLPSNVTLFHSGKVESEYIAELDTVVYGIGLNMPNSSEHLLENFRVEDDDKINLMLFHGDLVSKNQSSDYFPVTEEEIINSGLDYLALGHIHKATTAKKLGNTYYSYSGIPQGRGFDELLDKGVIIGEISKNSKKFEFVKTSKKEFIIKEIDVSNASMIYEISDLIKEEITNKNNIYRFLLVGSVNKNLSINTIKIASSLDLPYVEIEDNTTIKEDVHSLMQENTLKGLFVKNMLSQLEENSDDKRYENALKIGLEALSK
ncbi:MAG: DNA repair exonuclease [Clostridia bacterium]